MWGEEKLYVRGPQRMQGELLVQGSKNAGTPDSGGHASGKRSVHSALTVPQNYGCGNICWSCWKRLAAK